MIDSPAIAASPLPRLGVFLGATLLACALLVQAPVDDAAAGPTLESLIAPLAPGREVTRGYRLSAPHRGVDHDVVLTARRTSARGDETIEIHVLDRGHWSDIPETPSFGVAYEAPRSDAAVGDSVAVRDVIAAALRAHDPGGLGPVDAIALSVEPAPPTITRILDRMEGPRGLAVGVCLVVSVGVLATLPHGAWLAALALLGLGLVLRAPHLDLPFVRDQDVQRLFTGHLPLRDILGGAGLMDRHPPLYFVVLHFAQFFGQAESVVRMPAAIAGAFAGPVVVLGAVKLGARSELAAIVGLATTVSSELVLRSREVSPIPLFALFALGAALALAQHRESPTRGWTWLLVTSHALALHTYHLAAFTILGQVLVAMALGGLPKKTWRAVGLGCALGSPALGLAVITFLRDRGARHAAELHPGLAWGERSVAETARQLAVLARDAHGPLFLVLFAAACVVGIRRRDLRILAPAGAFVSGAVAIAALAPVARVQAYYLASLLPLVALSIALAVMRARTRFEPAAITIVALVVALTCVPRLRGLRTAYLPDLAAFMPSFARMVVHAPERRVFTTAHFDATLLAYYVAREKHVVIDWRSIDPRGSGFRIGRTGLTIEPLHYAHSTARAPGDSAPARLDEARRSGPVLVIERDDFRIESVRDALRECELLADVGLGRLRRCAPSHD